MEFKGELPSSKPSQSDWEWVRKQAAEDAPVPYDPKDPDDGPYDPNDEVAVERFLTEKNRVPNTAQTRLKKAAGAS
jgi:hypothetical protein